MPTIEARSPNFYIVDASDLIDAYVSHLISTGNLAETERNLLTEVLNDAQTNFNNISFGDVEYSLVSLARWLKESGIDVPLSFINSDEGIEDVDPSLIFVNMGQ